MFLTGVDEDVIISVLVKRNNEQRQKIRVVYEASTGKVSNSFLKNGQIIINQRQTEHIQKKKVKAWKNIETLNVQQPSDFTM